MYFYLEQRVYVAETHAESSLNFREPCIFTGRHVLHIYSRTAPTFSGYLSFAVVTHRSGLSTRVYTNYLLRIFCTIHRVGDKFVG